MEILATNASANADAAEAAIQALNAGDQGPAIRYLDRMAHVMGMV